MAGLHGCRGLETKTVRLGRDLLTLLTQSSLSASRCCSGPGSCPRRRVRWCDGHASVSFAVPVIVVSDRRGLGAASGH